MGSSNPKPQSRFAPETGLEPHFHVTDAIYEAQADGTIRVSIYEEVHGELRLQCTATVMPANLIRMSARAQRTGAEAINVTMFQKLFNEEGGGTH